MIDLIIYFANDEFVAMSDYEGAIFNGTGKTAAEAIGNFFIANREAMNFKYSIIINKEFVSSTDKDFISSTTYGKKRTLEELGPTELRHYNKLRNILN